MENKNGTEPNAAKLPLVLAVDDQPTNLQVIGSVLQANGFDVTLSASGEEALVIVSQTPPDLILLDLMMPGMDGYEVCAALKKNITTSLIPIIFLTAKTETEDIVAGFNAGCVDYVKKPFCPEELLARVKTHVHLHRLRSLISACSYCMSVKDDDGSWLRMDQFLRKKTDVNISHGCCPACYKKIMTQNGLPA